jgi:hypothetical protein
MTMSIGRSGRLTPSTTGIPDSASMRTDPGVWIPSVRYTASTRRDKNARTSSSSSADEKPLGEQGNDRCNQARCDAMKLEGGAEMADRVAGIAKAGIPVVGHLVLTPQSVSALGGFRLQGKGAAQAKKIVDDARALEEAGAFCILMELVPDRVCKLVTERARNCIIMSLGSGPDAHGQLLIYHDACTRASSRAWPRSSWTRAGLSARGWSATSGKSARSAFQVRRIGSACRTRNSASWQGCRNGSVRLIRVRRKFRGNCRVTVTRHLHARS